MKARNIGVAILLVFTLWGKAAAVWPPETSLRSEEKTPSDRRDKSAIERLEEDTRRLEAILKDLKQDHEDLKNSPQTVLRNSKEMP